MSGYKYIDQTELGWRDNRDNLNLRLRQISRRVQNEVLREISAVYWDQVNQGKIVKIDPTDQELENLWLEHTSRVIGVNWSDKKDKSKKKS